MYYKLEEQEKQTFQLLKPNDFCVNNIENTLHKLYKEGVLDADKIWKDALEVYCKNHNMEYKDVYCEMLTILNS